MRPPIALDRDSIKSLLQELSNELERRGAQADIFLVGGAAMALAYDARRATRDLDGRLRSIGQRAEGRGGGRGAA